MFLNYRGEYQNNDFNWWSSGFLFNFFYVASINNIC